MCEDYEISYCTAKDNFYSGIIIERAGKNGSVHHNECSDNSHGILCKDDGEFVKIEKNKLNKNREMGLLLQDVKQTIVEDNQIMFNGSQLSHDGYGIYAKNTSGVIIKGNVIQGNNAPGLYFTQDSGKKTIGAIFEGNSIIQNCLTYRIDNEAEVFIDRAYDISWINNVVIPTRRAFVINRLTTFKQFSQESLGNVESLTGSLSEILPINLNLNSKKFRFPQNTLSMDIKIPVEMRLIAIAINVSVNEKSGIALKVNGNQLFIIDVEKNSFTEFKKEFLTKVKKDYVFNIETANTINNSYITSFEVEFLYI